MDDLPTDLATTLGDRYQIDRELGGGGMARVFVARELALERDVVIKVLSPNVAGELSHDRFQREIRFAATLQQANIVPLLSTGTTLGGLPYYIMPFVAGDSLRARLLAGPITAVAGPVESAMLVLDDGDVTRLQACDVALGLGWRIATALLGLWALVNVGWVSRMVRMSRLRLGESAPSSIDGVPVVMTESLGPATVGVWRSRVVLPRWVLALPNAQRDYIVRHEDEHRRSHDSTLLFLASLAVILLPWNAAIWWQLRRLSLAVEMDCDRRVVSTLGDAHAYGSMLLAVAQASNRGTRLQPALLGGTGMLERRLTLLLAPTPLRRVQRLLLPLAALVLLFLVLTMPHPVMANHAQHDSSASSTPTSTVATR